MSEAAPTRRLVLIDGHANVFRAYHAIREALTNSRGEPTHATLGFINSFLRLRRQVDCSHVVFVFDAHAPSFRHVADENYKANRRETPADLLVQLQRIRQILAAMRVPMVESPGFEADDELATLAVRALEAGGRALICSVDKDILQVVRPGITVWREHLGKTEELDSDGVRARMGVPPEQIADYLALVGDSSDNIAGIPGVGPKTAVQLLEEYGSVAALVAAASSLPDKKKKLKENILAHGERCLRTLDMTRLRLDVPVEFSWERFAWKLEPTEELRRLLLELEFGRLLSELGLGATPAAAAPAAPKPATRKPTVAEGDTQTSLFDEPQAEEAAPHQPQPAQPAAQERNADYRNCTDAAAVRAAADAIRKARIAAIDTETTGLDPFTSDLVGISLSWEHNQGVYIPLGHRDGAPQVSLEEARAILNPLFAEPGIEWIAHHWKFDWRMLDAAGFAPPTATDDTMLSAWLLVPDRAQAGTYGLKGLARDKLGVEMTTFAEVAGTGRDANIALVPAEVAGRYAAQDADMTLALHRWFAPKLEEAGLTSVLRDIEMPLAPVLCRMEREGVRIDREYFAQLSREVEADLASISAEIHSMAGREFNINSPRQVGEVLFEDLKLPAGKKVKSGGYSTDVTVLEELAKSHPLPARLLDYRRLEKLRGTYIDALPNSINRRTGRVHTYYGQTDAATGRLASNSPNLQNIPVRTRDGQRVRRGFTARQPGWKLVAADYSQIELRILAHMSGDAALAEAFRAGADIHALTASRVLGIPVAELTPAQRNQAKAINFGIIYGMGAFSLSRQLEIPRATAEQFIADYFRAYPGVKAFMEATRETAHQTGFVRTMTGRRRPIADINSPNQSIRNQAERIAINTPIQGTSADMIKLAMIRVDRRIAAEGLRARMILQVHDELIIDAPADEVERVKGVLTEEMAAALPLGEVPIRVDVEAGDNWSEV